MSVQPAATSEEIFVDEVMSDRTADSVATKRLLLQKEYILRKFQHYCASVSLQKIRQESSGQAASSSAQLRSLRTFCLLLKATTQVNSNGGQLRQIKDNEWFDQYEKIQQYLHS